jgi:DNA repair photolyase
LERDYPRADIRRTIAIGTNTDPYQPIERNIRSCAVFSKCSSVGSSCRHRHQIGARAARSRYLARMAECNLVKVDFGHHARS